ncbi:ParB/Srx family N-terminal domain-containing protein [Pseudaestuariivita rosea]|uniref:ParB/Srx family N-terminal domain-containing protein n=1 Tax=Pseudaestuariivita rosea TaxID=2763263 RepID=UPI001ABAEFCB|nr:ParB/Srx family N-terminal domain-containing protein [Pseudaestuariivita rosea]
MTQHDTILHTASETRRSPAAIQATDQSPSVLIDIPLNHLTLSPLNPRQACTAEDITALATSIRTVGLMQNLMGFQSAEGDSETTIAIVAGGRRLRALQQIAAEDGTDPSTIVVPVRVTDDLAQANY